MMAIHLIARSVFCPWGFPTCAEVFSLPPLAVDFSLFYLVAMLAVFWKAYKASQGDGKDDLFSEGNWTYSLAAAAA